VRIVEMFLQKRADNCWIFFLQITFIDIYSGKIFLECAMYKTIVMEDD